MLFCLDRNISLLPCLVFISIATSAYCLVLFLSRSQHQLTAMSCFISLLPCLVLSRSHQQLTAMSCFVSIATAAYCLVLFCLDRNSCLPPCLVLSYVVTPAYVLYRISSLLPCLVLYHDGSLLPCLVLCRSQQHFSVLSCITIATSALSCLVLSCLVLSCLVLSIFSHMSLCIYNNKISKREEVINLHSETFSHFIVFLVFSRRDILSLLNNRINASEQSTTML